MAFTEGWLHAIPRPLYVRTQETDICVRRAVVHITTIAAYCNLLRLRGERILSWKLFFYALLPLGPLAWHTLGSIALLLLWSYEHQYGSSPNTKEFRRFVRWTMNLNTELRDDRVQQDDLVQLTKEAEPDNEPPRRSFRHVISLMVLPTLFFAQSATIIAVYLHRRWHNALNFTDQRVLELAFSGIFTTVNWIGLLLDLPLFRPTPPPPGTRLHLAQPHLERHFDTILLFTGSYYRAVVLSLPAFLSQRAALTWDTLIQDAWFAYAAMVAINVFRAVDGEYERNGKMTSYRQASPREKRVLLGLAAFSGVEVLTMIMFGVFMPLCLVIMGGFEFYWGMEDLKASAVNVTIAGLWEDDFGRWVWPFA